MNYRHRPVTVFSCTDFIHPAETCRRNGFSRLPGLDDILISLDMTHRRTLLEILNEKFAGGSAY